MPTYVIHIGPPKTATTYLQHNFRALRGELLERGVWHPDWWEAGPKAPTHAGLTRRLREGDRAALAPRFEQLNRSSCRYILLSSESLVSLEPDKLAMLRELIGDHPIRVICYCRSWAAHAYSYWQETIRQGWVLTLPELLARLFQGPDMDLGLFPEKFSRIFGQPSLKLVSYDELVGHQIDLFEHFAASFLDWPEARRAHVERANPSQAPGEIEIIRVLNSFAASNNGPVGAAMRRRFVQALPSLELGSLLAAMQASLKTLEIDETVPPLSINHEETFRRFGDCLVEPAPPGRLFELRRRSLEYVDGGYLLDPRNVEGLRALYARLAQPPQR
jgi:hypothetical protein